MCERVCVRACVCERVCARACVCDSVYVCVYVSPSLRPPGVTALLSPGQVFLLAVMDTSSRTLSARAPSIPCGLRSTRTR